MAVDCAVLSRTSGVAVVVLMAGVVVVDLEVVVPVVVPAAEPVVELPFEVENPFPDSAPIPRLL
jgi:hypothetical protein